MKSTLLNCLAPALLLGALFAPLASPVRAQAPDVMRWSGDVDDTTLVYIHADDVQTRTIFGKSASNINSQFFGRLPRGPYSVFLRHRAGRGQVRIVEQPTPDNNFTAVVRLHDPQSGRSHYEFTLAWQPLPDLRDRDGDRDGNRGGNRDGGRYR